MQTIETPSEQPENNRDVSQRMIDALEQAASGSGFNMLRRMYLEPYKPHIFFSDYLDYSARVQKTAELIVLGFVAYTSAATGGFQLTADGRLAFHIYYTDFKARLERQAEREREIERMYPRDEWNEYAFGVFDLLDF